MLRAALLPDLCSFTLKGGPRSAARALVEVAKDYHPKGDSNWIQYLFEPYLWANEKGMRIPLVILEAVPNSKRRFFRVHLGSLWRKSKIEVIAAGNKDPLKPEGIRRFADALAATFEQDERTEERVGIDLDLLAWNPRCRQLIPIQNNQLPLAPDSGVSLNVNFTHAVFPCVIWITSLGVVQPLYPWQELTWNLRPNLVRLAKLQLPTETTGNEIAFYPLKSKPGVETAIVLAATAPLKGNAARSLQSISQLAKHFYPRALPDPSLLYLLADPRPADKKGSVLRLGKPYTSENPLATFMHRLVQNVGPLFDSVSGVSFATHD